MRRTFLSLLFLSLALLVPGLLVPVQVRAQTPTPTVSVSPSTAKVGSTVTVSGTGFTPQDWVYVYWQRPDKTTNGTYVYTDSGGTFSLQLTFSSSHGTGYEYVAGYDYTAGTWAPFVAIMVTSGEPPPGTLQLSVSPNPISAGDSATVEGKKFSSTNTVYLQWTRPDGTTGSDFVYTDFDGHFALALAFLAVHGCGIENIQAYDYGTDTWSDTYPVTVSGC